jgi:predicted HNH restriction endonuclease
VFAKDSLKIFGVPIPVEHIRTIAGLEHFGVHKKDRSPYRNLTKVQYLSLLNFNNAFETLSDSYGVEGRLSEQRLMRHSRNRAIVEQRKKIDDYTCQACGFKLLIADKYIIDCHHLVPFQFTDERITSIEEIVCLCPTCHRIAHVKQPPMGIAEIAEYRQFSCHG